MHDKLYFVVVNFNSWKDTIELIHSIYNNSPTNFQIIIVENCSTDQSEKKLINWLNGKMNLHNDSKFFNKKLNGKMNYLHLPLNFNNNINFDSYDIILCKTKKNLGFAGGNNYAINNFINLEIKSNILLINPDICLENHAVYHSQKISQKHEKFIMGFKIMNYYKPKEILSIGGSMVNHGLSITKDIKDYNDIKNIDYIYGGALFTNSKTLKEIGLLPEEYFLYWEEADFCMKAKKLKIPLIVSNKSICYDKVGQSIGRGELSEYLFTYNSFIFYKKYFKRYKMKLILKHFIRLVYRLINLNLKNAKGILRGMLHYLNRKENEYKTN